MKCSPVAQLVKNLLVMQETWVRSLGWEDALEKGQATHSSILAWRVPWTVDYLLLYSKGNQLYIYALFFRFFSHIGHDHLPQICGWLLVCVPEHSHERELCLAALFKK